MGNANRKLTNNAKNAHSHTNRISFTTNDSRYRSLMDNQQTEPNLVWRISSLSDVQLSLLCSGYSRMNFNKYIIDPVIQLFCNYYMNDSLLDDIKNAKQGESFSSPIFSMNSFKFYLKLYPNGNQYRYKGTMILFIYSLSLSPQISRVKAQYSLLLKEINSRIPTKSNLNLSQNTLSSALNFATRIYLKNIQQLNQLTFEMNLEIILLSAKDDCFNKLSNIYNSNTPTIQLPMIQYRWKVTNKAKTLTLSDTFKYGVFKWYLKFLNDALYLVFATIPMDISEVAIKYRIYLEETHQINEEDNAIFENQYHSNFRPDAYKWKTSDILLMSDIEILDELSFCVDFVVHQVYDVNHGVIPNFIENDSLNYRSTSLSTQLPIAQYEWKIIDCLMMNKIKNAKVEQDFNSKIVEIGEIKLYLSLYPNGASKPNEGKTRIDIQIIDFPEKLISKLICNLKLIFHEMDIVICDCVCIDKMPMLCWDITTIKHLQKLQTVTFDLELTSIDAFDIDGNLMENYIQNHELKEVNDAHTINDSEWNLDDNLLTAHLF